LCYFLSHHKQAAIYNNRGCGPLHIQTLLRILFWFIHISTEDIGFTKEKLKPWISDIEQGEHKNGETIAVKLLHYIPGLDDEQFKKEYLNLASLQHKNIVRLVGYCHETRREILPFDGKMVFAEMTKRALCFEYMENGSLDKYLSGMLH
jgi:serine/threonine protein kinase